VRRVTGGCLRQGASLNECCGKPFSRFGCGQLAQTCQRRQALPRPVLISGRNLVKYYLRDTTGEQGATPFPPLASYLLMPRHNQIAARLSHQVTYDRRFNVHGFHVYLFQSIELLLFIPPQVKRGAGHPVQNGRHSADGDVLDAVFV
jgi:hypothetical protein